MTNYYKTTYEGNVIGTRMHAALVIVAHRGPLASKNQLAIKVGPNGSQDYGYRIVNRCLRDGLLTVDSDHEVANPHGLGAVILTERGYDYLATNSDIDVVDTVTVER